MRALAVCCRLTVQNENHCGLGIYFAKSKQTHEVFPKANPVSVLIVAISFVICDSFSP